MYAADCVGDQGRVLGIDLREVTLRLPSNCKTRVEDAYKFRGGSVPQLDVVMSDMAPDMGVNKQFDHLESCCLVELAMGGTPRTVAASGGRQTRVHTAACGVDVRAWSKRAQPKAGGDAARSVASGRGRGRTRAREMAKAHLRQGPPDGECALASGPELSDLDEDAVAFDVVDEVSADALARGICDRASARH
ncbi:unnamed protein product [Prorocentrum cordatum]|uniref:Ribosomal RNA methyltransferase FtsJ domain-containing protein n=1 Tax=Prorocentrum cordatum TaxID=2364126 RepID=A0ABN9RDG5_9DINO|nr:unnamed protein product [Polarella glacialis]